MEAALGQIAGGKVAQAPVAVEDVENRPDAKVDVPPRHVLCPEVRQVALQLPTGIGQMPGLRSRPLGAAADEVLVLCEVEDATAAGAQSERRLAIP